MITKFKLFENNTFSQLKDILIGIQPGKIINGLDTSEEIVALINRGDEYDESFVTERLNGSSNQCHRNSADFYKDYQGKYKIVSGYAFFNDKWVSHSWLINDYGDFIETVQIKYTHYYGYILNEKECEIFISENY